MLICMLGYFLVFMIIIGMSLTMYYVCDRVWWIVPLIWGLVALIVAIATFTAKCLAHCVEC